MSEEDVNPDAEQLIDLNEEELRELDRERELQIKDALVKRY